MNHSQWFPGFLGLKIYEHLYNGHKLEIINSCFYMSIVVLGGRDTTARETERQPYPSGAYILLKEIANKANKEIKCMYDGELVVENNKAVERDKKYV